MYFGIVLVLNLKEEAEVVVSPSKSTGNSRGQAWTKAQGFLDKQRRAPINGNKGQVSERSREIHISSHLLLKTHA